MIRFVCPSCKVGSLGPSRMHKDDVRRFCLACSGKGKRLVRLTCVAAMARRERQRMKREGAAARARDKRKATREHLAELNRHNINILALRQAAKAAGLNIRVRVTEDTAAVTPNRLLIPMSELERITVAGKRRWWDLDLQLIARLVDWLAQWGTISPDWQGTARPALTQMIRRKWLGSELPLAQLGRCAVSVAWFLHSVATGSGEAWLQHTVKEYEKGVVAT